MKVKLDKQYYGEIEGKIAGYIKDKYNMGFNPLKSGLYCNKLILTPKQMITNPFQSP